MLQEGYASTFAELMEKTRWPEYGSRRGNPKCKKCKGYPCYEGFGTEEDSLRAEIRLGRDLAAALLQRVPLVEENERTRFAEQIGRWLAARVKEKKLPFSVRVTAEREPNALALPGGPIFVSWPLLEMCQGERDDIAFLLRHVIGHIVARHTRDRILKATPLSLSLRQSSP